MSRRISGRFCWASLRLVAGLFLGMAVWQAAAPVAAQVVVAQPYWWCFDERVSYAVACKTLAEARVINAKAYSMELDNWLKHAQIYWERRRLYEAEYRRLHPEEWKVEEERQKRMTQLVMDQYQRVLRGDTTRASNWVLREMANSLGSFQSVSGKSTIQSDFDSKLTKEDLKNIRLTDRGRNGKPLFFAPSADNVLLPPWPVLLLAPEFDKARENYERTQKAVADDVKATGKFSHKNHTDLIDAVERLYTALNSVYPEEKRKDTKVYETEYRPAKQAIDVLSGNVTRAVIINDASVLDGQLQFKGDSLFALVQHMYEHGLEFAPPQRGTAAEATYMKVFTGLRQIYARIAKDDRKGPDAKQERDNGDGARGDEAKKGS
jgi:hypothetical protein